MDQVTLANGPGHAITASRAGRTPALLLRSAGRGQEPGDRPHKIEKDLEDLMEIFEALGVLRGIGARPIPPFGLA